LCQIQKPRAQPFGEARAIAFVCLLIDPKSKGAPAREIFVVCLVGE